MTASKTASLSATATGTIDLSQEVVNTPHVSIGIKFLDGSGNVVAPSTGTFSLTVKHPGTDVFESISGGDDIDATGDDRRFSYSEPADVLKYDPTGITGAVTVEITIIGNDA